MAIDIDRDNRNPLEVLFWNGFNRLREHDEILLTVGVSERTLCARLAMYFEECMAEDYPDHHADVEYNRTLTGEKRILEAPCNCEEHEIPRRRRIRDRNVVFGTYDWNERWDRAHNRITADLVVHSRGLLRQVDENMIAVEIKKTDANLQDCDFDRCRLRRMTLPWFPGRPRAIGYRFAFFICLKAIADGAKRAQQFHSPPLGPSEPPNEDYRGWDEWGYVETFAEGVTTKLTPFRSVPVNYEVARDLGFQEA